MTKTYKNFCHKPTKNIDIYNFKKIQKFHFPRNMGINKQISRFMSKFDVRFFLIFVDIHFRIISHKGDDLCVNQ